MKLLKLLSFLFSGCLFFSCADPKAVYFDVPTLMSMSQKQIIGSLGYPKSTTKLDSYATQLSGGPIVIPRETVLETYYSGGYGIRFAYILSKCNRPIEVYLFDSDLQGKLDTVLLKNAGNLNIDSLLPYGTLKEELGNGYKLKNLGCQ